METSRTARNVLIAAGALGFLGDHLVRAPVWGLNVALFAIVLAVRGAALARRREGAHPDRSSWPWFAAAFFAAMWVVRDSETLLAFNLMAALSLLSLPLLQRRVSLPSAGVIPTALAPVFAGFHAVAGTADALRWIPWRSAEGSKGKRRATALGLGLLLAAPLVLIFGALFSMSDPVFGAAATSVLRVDIEPVISHTAVAGVFAWISGGYLWTLSRPASTKKLLPPIRITPPDGMLQPVLIAMGATAFLFVVFLALQANSLFGGAAYVQAQMGLSFAEYARSGFFEMVTASAFTLPVVYAAPFVAGKVTEAESRSLRALMSLQLLLTSFLLASALWRMALYMGAYGLTEDRLHGTAVMVWIGLTIAVFSRTVLRGRPAAAAFGSVLAAVATLAALNLVNPQALIVRHNLSHIGRREVDLSHLTALGGDAVPALVSRLDVLEPAQRCTVVRDLVDRYATATGDWRGLNLARWRARRAASAIEVSCQE